MNHELPNGKLHLFDIDLSYMSETEFNAMRELICRHAFIAEDYPAGQQRMKVYWNLVESPDSVLGLPSDSVSLISR